MDGMVAISAAQEVYEGDEYVTTVDGLVESLVNNTSYDQWSLRYCAAQAYIDLNGRTLDKSYLEKAYEIVLDNVNSLVPEQRKLNDSYLADIQEIPVKKGAADEKEIKQYNTMLNASIKNESPISRVKYVSNNSILTDNKENSLFKQFIEFVDRMLLFYSLDSRGYEGFMNGSEGIAEGIINSGKVKEFQSFLKENDIDYELYEREVDGRKAIYCHFDKQDADFFQIASTGTRSLALFYYWFIRMQRASFVFIDEFDAFYHFELSDNVERHLKEISEAQIFTTTHNTNLLSNDQLRPDCYFILKNNKIRAISNLTEKELRLAHNLQKMYKAGAFNG